MLFYPTSHLKSTLPVFFQILFFYSVASSQSAYHLQLVKQTFSDSTISFRGISAVSKKVAWASGNKGTVLKTEDGGATWQKINVPNSEKLDFRDIEAFDEKTAFVLSITQPAKILKTEDGGKTWQEQFLHPDPEAFLDALAFWDKNNGMVFGDPLKGKFLAYRTGDGGKSWKELNNLPTPLEGEAAFAASGTCLLIQGKNKVWIGSGGSFSRVFISTDKGQNWESFSSPLLQGKGSQGIFSVAFKNEKEVIIVGGDYEQAQMKDKNAAISKDGGKSWQLIVQNPPGGYRSSVVFVPKTNYCLTVGTSGMDSSEDGGQNWKNISPLSLNSLHFAAGTKTGWAVGGKGRIVKILLMASK